MNNTQCKFCKSELNEGATVCHHCGNPQNRFMHILYSFNYAATIVSIIFLIVAVSQCSEAKRDRVSAQKALNKANSIEIEAAKVKQELDSVLTETYKAKQQIDSIKEDLKYTLSIEH